MARKMCRIGCGRAVATGTGGGVDDDREHAKSLGICNICLTEAEWENEHNDNDHGTGPDQEQPNDCWVCFPELNEAKKPHTPKAGHTNTVAKTRTSHVGHGHALTPMARAVCRRTMIETGKPWDGTGRNAK